ncbi:hypothetical protein [Streptomyces sp. WG7]|uniref:hypothetical protein n=1 Tax=Streptomyces sp. WG7 TaxID=3417650 RepID=UPI003CEA381D
MSARRAHSVCGASPASDEHSGEDRVGDQDHDADAAQAEQPFDARPAHTQDEYHR